MIDVSIVIVCMNNLNNLYPCLNSIKKYTTKVTYETLVVAYLFTQDNIDKVKADFPWVTFIESNELRGFSENNNLALRCAKGKYLFVLNDDTELKMPVIDNLVKSIERLPSDVAAVSPRSVYADGTIQSCGRPVHTTWTYVKSLFNLWNERKYILSNEHRRGLFETGDLVGALFLIKADIFEKIGFFDETYYFCPEDIAVSFELRKLGYKCYVDCDVDITHYEGMSGGNSVSWVKTATAPAGTKGELIFYSHRSPVVFLLLTLLTLTALMSRFLLMCVYELFSRRSSHLHVKRICCQHSILACLSNKTPKELFIHYYNKIQK